VESRKEEEEEEEEEEVITEKYHWYQPQRIFYPIFFSQG
jgi:hypothetical protein